MTVTDDCLRRLRAHLPEDIVKQIQSPAPVDLEVDAAVKLAGVVRWFRAANMAHGLQQDQAAHDNLRATVFLEERLNKGLFKALGRKAAMDRIELAAYSKEITRP